MSMYSFATIDPTRLVRWSLRGCVGLCVSCRPRYHNQDIRSWRFSSLFSDVGMMPAQP